uniref:Uncharacterized protein n=1 Tax=Solanum tuberosum TaxID=4113 RepID=M1DQZ2_SOLTU
MEISLSEVHNATTSLSSSFLLMLLTPFRSVPSLDCVGHQTEMNRYRTGTGKLDRVVDRYRDELDRNYRDGGLVPSCPTIYRDRIGTDRSGSERNGMGQTGQHI